MARKITVCFKRRWRNFEGGTVHTFDYGIGRTLVDKGWATEVAAVVDSKAIHTGQVRNKARKAVSHGA